MMFMPLFFVCSGLRLERSTTQEVCVLKERYPQGLELTFPMEAGTCSENCNTKLLCDKMDHVMEATFATDDNLCQCKLNQQLVLSKSRQQATCNWAWCWDSYLEVLSEERAADQTINVRRAMRLVSHWDASCKVASQVHEVTNDMQQGSAALDDCDEEKNLYPTACHLEVGPGGGAWRDSVHGCLSNNYLLVHNGRKLVGLYVSVETRFIHDLQMKWKRPQELRISFKMDSVWRKLKSTFGARAFQVRLRGFQGGKPAEVWTSTGYQLTLVFQQTPPYLDVTWKMRAPVEKALDKVGLEIPEVVENTLSYVNLEHVVRSPEQGTFRSEAMHGCIE